MFVRLPTAVLLMNIESYRIMFSKFPQFGCCGDISSNPVVELAIENRAYKLLNYFFIISFSGKHAEKKERCRGKASLMGLNVFK